MAPDQDQLLEDREKITSLLRQYPYSSRRYLDRAACHDALGYPDLAAGDAYRALLLADEILNEDGEYHRQAVECITIADIRLYGHRADSFNADFSNDLIFEAGFTENEDFRRLQDDKSWHQIIGEIYASECYLVLAHMLTACGDLRTAYLLLERGLKALPDQDPLQKLKKEILGKCHEKGHPVGSQFNPKEDLPENGFARREVYPWNTHEPDRFSEEHLKYINQELGKIAPKCEVRETNLPVLSEDASPPLSRLATVKQLGIFAASDIKPHEPLLLEPSVLTSSTGLHDPFCDACSTPLPSIASDSSLPSCLSCEDVYFCSQACLDRAQDLYHSAVCGITDFDVISKDPSHFTATSALYMLLNARTMAMSETQGVHPLDLPQVKYLWGDYSQDTNDGGRTLPFNFSNNIAQPLHLLTRLNIDPFAPEKFDRYDTWVTNTLLAKFRGTANAKMNERTGMPEVAGVHWLWCLANHSCAPNVRWEWEKGGMGFVARGGEDVVRLDQRVDEDVAKGRWEGGIKSGQEVLNHYCDIGLPVKERREWAVGALGGMCVCERCMLEEKENGMGNPGTA